MNAFDPRLPIIAAEARVKTCHVFHCWHALREMGKTFHAAAFAQFAGLEEKHVSAILSALTAHNALPEGRTPTNTRGTRLGLDFAMPEEWSTWAIAQRRWSPFDTGEEAEIFANYWQSKTGQAATKVDWFKTWQNWVRNSKRPNGTYQQVSTPVQATRDHLERTAALYERMGRTSEAAQIRASLAPTVGNVLPFDRKIA